MAATSGTVAQGTLLLVAYALGPRRAVPARSRSSTTARRRSSRPLVRHGRHVSLIGGLLVSAIGVAMVFDWLRAAAALLPRS